jgi:hypothetical protein
VNFQKELKKKEQMQLNLKNGIGTNNSSSLGGIKGKSDQSTPSFKKSGKIKKKMAQAIFNSINTFTNKTSLVRKSAATGSKDEPQSNLNQTPVAFDESDSDHAKDSDSVTKSNLVHHGKYYMDSVRYYMTKQADQDTMGKLFKANFYEVYNAATGIIGYKPQNAREIKTKALRFPKIESQSEPVITNKGNPQPQNQNSQNTIGHSSGINKSISNFFNVNNYREKGYRV